MRGLLLAMLVLVLPGLAQANAFEPVRDKAVFLSLVKNKDLRIGLYNLTLKVTPDGRINGTALGWAISGSWRWEDGYFCRDMDWSGYAIPFNCQLVEARNGQDLRFTVDRGAGKSASFRLR
ncbi:MAG: dihydrodipicolinate reductase [Pseudotabrizicola sp.]|uniref:dihydrodipicolinate reductase n=1 Tax=Pseudotabrizicola sp. TaxID=2939647 RepID=UPI00271C4B37|nr:dihydrodipicolinate reductase [Pseudotabrizicola sp.]MDO9638994.1 dihydrodipicolinate reductase [Pseudotabrizicola sp.]